MNPARTIKAVRQLPIANERVAQGDKKENAYPLVMHGKVEPSGVLKRLVI
jgi:hypothetical protein